MLVLFLLYPLAAFAWGSIAIYPFRQSFHSANSLLYKFILGIFLTNALYLLLKSVSVPWAWVWVIILAAIPAQLTEVQKAQQQIKFSACLNINFIIWAFINLLIGCSLFEVTSEGIQSIWISNYGDLAFHLGMLASFVFGDNFYPQYNIFAGHTLSYPFTVNLWSSAFWSQSPQFLGLKYVFFYQWQVVWLSVYFLLKGNLNKLLPWVILLGGGVYFSWSKEAPPMIEQGFFWVPLLPTTWIPQRSAMLGLLLLLTSLKIFFEYLQNPVAGRSLLFYLALLTASFPLVHGHFFLIFLGFIAIFSVCLFIQRKLSLTAVALLALSCLPAIITSISISDKAAIFHWMYDWTVGDKKKYWYLGTLLEQYMDSPLISMPVNWLVNAWPIFIIFGVFIYQTRNYLLVAVLLILFLVGNFVKMHYWDFDQVKYFVGLYVLFIFIWSEKFPKSRLNFLLLLLVIPGVVNLAWTVGDRQTYTTYSAKDLEIAENIRRRTPANAVIASAPDHNSAALLSGRKLYLGFVGTLWTHGINYHQRESANKDLLKIKNCEVEPCPNYLYWSESSRKYWKMETPPAIFGRTDLPYLFKVR